MIINAIVDHLDTTIAALADPTRRRTIDVLGHGRARASDLALAAGTSRAAMSRHLRVLRGSGLVEVEISTTDGREHVYRLRDDRLAALQDWIDEVRASWEDQLERFEAHVERRSDDRAR